MTILLIQPPCVFSSQVTELYIHRNFKFSKSNCQALTPFFWSSSCKGVKILNMSAGIISRGPAATGDYISFSILLLVSLSCSLSLSLLNVASIHFTYWTVGWSTLAFSYDTCGKYTNILWENFIFGIIFGGLLSNFPWNQVK